MFANSVAGKFLYFDRGDKDISEFLGSGEGYNFLISNYNETPNDKGHRPAQGQWTKDEQLVCAGSGATASSAASHAWSRHLLNHSLLAKPQIQ